VPFEQATASSCHCAERRPGICVGHDHRAPRPEARERVAPLDRWDRGGAHDWLVVTPLTPPVEPLLEDDEPLFEDDELPFEDDEEPLDAEPDDVVDVSPLEGVVVVEVSPLEVVVVAGDDATVVVDELLPDDFLASAGSCPETSTSVIISQAATNSATEPAMIRRRIVRARATRALRSACPRARAPPPSLISVMSCTSWSVAYGESKRANSFGPARISRVRDD